MNRFDIWIIQFDPTRGSEIKKTRPAVIISPSFMNRNLNTVIVAPLTSTIRGYPSRIETDFADRDGEIALDQLRCVDKERLIEKVGRLDPDEAKAVTQILGVMFQE